MFLPPSHNTSLVVQKSIPKYGKLSQDMYDAGALMVALLPAMRATWPQLCHDGRIGAIDDPRPCTYNAPGTVSAEGAGRVVCRLPCVWSVPPTTMGRSVSGRENSGLHVGKPGGVE